MLILAPSNMKWICFFIIKITVANPDDGTLSNPKKEQPKPMKTEMVFGAPENG